MKEFLLVFTGGGIGACSRYGVGLLVQQFSDRFWFSTLIVNLIGCFLFYLLSRYIGAEQKGFQLLMLTGFLGALTTFSTFSFEVYKLFSMNRFFEGTLVVFLNVFFGIIIGFFILTKKFLN